MLEVMLVSALSAGIAVPHYLPLQRVAPMLAAVLWLLALALRALVAIGAALFVFLYLPATGIFTAITAWCWHEVLPIMATHLGLSGHPVAHAAVVLPGLALTGSLTWLGFGLAKGWWGLRRQLQDSLGVGPWGSTVVADARLLVAATVLGRGRIVLSPAALDALDDQELRASIAHELAHLRRRHRPLLLLASVLAALGRILPRTASAERELIFHLERDADEYAVKVTETPLALASAICKAAGSSTNAVLSGLRGRGRVSRRLDILIDGNEPRDGAFERMVGTVVAVLAAGVLALAVSLPVWALDTPPTGRNGLSTATACPD